MQKTRSHAPPRLSSDHNNASSTTPRVVQHDVQPQTLLHTSDQAVLNHGGTPHQEQGNKTSFDVQDAKGRKIHVDNRERAELHQQHLEAEVEADHAERISASSSPPLIGEDARCTQVHQETETGLEDAGDGDKSAVVSDAKKVTFSIGTPSKPPAPYVEDCLSDGSEVVPAPLRMKGPPARTRTIVPLLKPRREAASDSGYSSVSAGSGPIISHKAGVTILKEVAEDTTGRGDGDATNRRLSAPLAEKAQSPTPANVPTQKAFARKPPSSSSNTRPHLPDSDADEAQADSTGSGVPGVYRQERRDPKSPSVYSPTSSETSSSFSSSSSWERLSHSEDDIVPSESASRLPQLRQGFSRGRQTEVPLPSAPPQRHSVREVTPDRSRRHTTSRNDPQEVRHSTHRSKPQQRHHRGRTQWSDISTEEASEDIGQLFTDEFLLGSLSTKSFLRMALQSSQEMVNEVTAALIRPDELQFVMMTLVLDPDIVHSEVRTSIQRAIQRFGKQLQFEASGAFENAFGAAFQDTLVSLNAADLLIRPYKLARRQSRVVAAVAGDQSFFMPSPHVEQTTIWHEVLARSRAYPAFKTVLMQLAHKPYEQRIAFALGSTMFNERGQRITSPKRAAEEISWVPTHRLSVSFEEHLAMADRLKGYVEESMDEVWNWWPLAPRVHTLRAGFCRFKWKEPSGRTRHVDVPVNVGIAIQRAIKTAPAFLRVHLLEPADAQSGSAGTVTGHNHTMRPSPVPATQSSQAMSSQLVPTKDSHPKGNPAPGTTSSSHAPISNQQTCQTALYVYLCTEAGSRRFIELDCTEIGTDVEFFDRIKCEYDKARGWFRLWFSTWRYDHCEFFQFQKTGIGLGARLKVAFPEAFDLLYQYEPRPPIELPPDGPISHDEFREHYYYKLCPPLWSWERWHTRHFGLSTADKEALEAVPKRVVKLDMENGKREHFYGLYAKEARSALRVAIYVAICNLPGFVFFFLWLYQWKHGSDLQGAAVPAELSLSLTVGFIGVLYWTR